MNFAMEKCIMLMVGMQILLATLLTLMALTHLLRVAATCRARQETINGCFKQFRCLKNVWRHDRKKHGDVMMSVAIIVQLGLREGNLSWEVDYDEIELDI